MPHSPPPPPPRLPTLKDPHAGRSGASDYLEYWGMELYLDWCRECGVTTPLPYAVFRAHTLSRGKDWWARQE